jgi:hypothetical protein
MIVSIFGPCGIITATAAQDTFYEMREYDDDIYALPYTINGLPHTFTFWKKYVLTYNSITPSAYDDQMQTHFISLERKWDKAPHIKDFMPYLKKLILDNHIQIIGVVSAYCEENGVQNVPFVYQILGEQIRRVNVDDKGNINYNCICLEKDPIVGRLLRKVKLLNGDIWEEAPECRFRYDLFSVSRSIDFCSFVVKTNHYINNANTTEYGDSLLMDISVVTPDSTEITQNNI